MIFHPRQKKINVNFPLVMENTIVKQAVETKFLGIIIDQRLCWKSHISFTSKKISKTVGIIAKARYYLSSKLLLTLYFSLVYPYLTYRNGAWSSTYCSNLNVRLIKSSLGQRIPPHYLANLKSLTYIALILFLIFFKNSSPVFFFCCYIYVQPVTLTSSSS